MNKKSILALVLTQLESDLHSAQAAAKTAHEASIGDESKAENQYDTRAVEAAYLAEAQAVRLEEQARAVHLLRQLAVVNLPEGTPVRAGALVQVESEGKQQWYFLLPSGAGIQVESEGQTIAVVTTTSPLGRELLGKRADDSVHFKLAGLVRDFEVLEVL